MEFDSYSPMEIESYTPSFGERMVAGTVKVMLFLMVVGALAVAGFFMLVVLWVASMMQ